MSMGTIQMLRNKVYIGEYTWKDKESENKYDIVIPRLSLIQYLTRLRNS